MKQKEENPDSNLIHKKLSNKTNRATLPMIRLADIYFLRILDFRRHCHLRNIGRRHQVVGRRIDEI